MGHYVLPRANRPGAGGGVTVGNPVTSGVANTALRVDGAGNLDSSNDFAMEDATGYFALGGAQPQVITGYMGGGREAHGQIRRNSAGVDLSWHAENSNVAGGAGFSSYAGGPTLEMYASAPSRAGTFLGQANAGTSKFAAAGGPALLGTRTAHNVYIGRNEIAYLLMDASGNVLLKAVTLTARLVANVAATIALGEGNIHMSGFTANRIQTLPARSGVAAGYQIKFTFTDNPGANNAVLTPAGADTFEGGASLSMTGARASWTIEAVGTVDWQRVSGYP